MVLKVLFPSRISVLMKNTPYKEFWHRLTGDSDFYYDLIDAFAEVADEMDSSAMIGQIIQRLAHEIDENNA